MKTKLSTALLALFFLCLLPSPSLSQGPDPKLIEGAKKEGEVVWWTTMSLNHSKPMVDRFEKKYPFIKVALYRTGNGPLLNKVLTEARAKRYAWDVVSGSGELYIPFIERKLLASYFSPEQKMFEDDMKGREGYWTAIYVNPQVLGFNTRLVKKEEVPRTYQDLLGSRWKKGKISIDTEGFSLLSGLTSAWGKEKAVTYLKKLAAQEPVVKRGNTERVQMTMSGEHPLVIANVVAVEMMAQQGAPIDWVTLEPVVIQVNPIYLAAKASHPNAARLFIDFALSREGQEMIRDFFRVPPRVDVETNPPRLIKGYKRVIEDPEGLTNLEETARLYRQIFEIQ